MGLRWISAACILVIIGSSDAATVMRSKRQIQTLYLCGTGSASYVSQNPCSNWGCTGGGCYNSGCSSTNCQYSSNNALTPILPVSFYNPTSNCNSGCSNVNCNNYYGQWMNGQYVAYNPTNNIYSPCASSCCNRQQYLPWSAPIGQGAIPNSNFLGSMPVPIGQGAMPSGTINNHACINGRCPTGYQCQNDRCVNVFSAPLLSCIDNRCTTGFECGVGNLCYPTMTL